MRLVCLLYCDYYLAQNAGRAFVATDEFDKPVGYVLSDVNFDDFAKVYPSFIASAKKESPLDFRNIKLFLKYSAEIADDYPAHLQINVLPSFQNRGIGRALVETAVARLRGEGVKGVHVVIKQSNASALAFFERLGFSKLLSPRKKFYVLGLKI